MKSEKTIGPPKWRERGRLIKKVREGHGQWCPKLQTKKRSPKRGTACTRVGSVPYFIAGISANTSLVSLPFPCPLPSLSPARWPRRLLGFRVWSPFRCSCRWWWWWRWGNRADGSRGAGAPLPRPRIGRRWRQLRRLKPDSRRPLHLRELQGTGFSPLRVLVVFLFWVSPGWSVRGYGREWDWVLEPLCCGSNSNSRGLDGEAEFSSLVCALYFLSEF